MILDLLFPKSCLGCGRIGIYICDSCSSTFEYINHDGCLYCDKKTDCGLTHERCQRPVGVDGLLSIMYYTPLIRKVLKEIKYGLVTDAIPDLCWSLDPLIMAKIGTFRRKMDNVLFLPMPLHKRRLNGRGFNQAELLVRFFSYISSIPMYCGLERIKDTPQQARLQRRFDRYLNIHKAFKVIDKEKIKNKNIIVVDDVITSGSTMKEVARELKMAGANKVFALSLIRD